MKIGITNNTYNRYPLDLIYRKMREHGYEMCDFQLADTEAEVYSMDDAALRQYLDAQRKAAESAGIGFSQVHGPWRWPPQDLTEEDRTERFEKMKRCLYMTSLLGCPFMVIHPIMPYGINDIGTENAPRTWDMNLGFMRRLLVSAHEYGVCIAIENMPFPQFSMAAPEMMRKFVDEIGDDHLKVCLDTGHSIICGVQPADAVRLLGERLKVVHIHDSRGSSDDHNPLFVGRIDWHNYCRALREIGFDGTFSFEFGFQKLPDEYFGEANTLYIKLAKSIIETP